MSADLVTRVSGCSHDAVAPLDRLVAVGVGAEGDRLHRVARAREFLSQQLGGVGLGEQLRLEIQARRKFKVSVTRAGIAVSTTLFASSIWIDRLLERHVGRIVPRDDRARALLGHRGGELRRGLVLARPAVVEGLARRALEAPLDRRARAAKVQRLAPRRCAALRFALFPFRHRRRR
jgi:hypothetical protein